MTPKTKKKLVLSLSNRRITNWRLLLTIVWVAVVTLSLLCWFVSPYYTDRRLMAIAILVLAGLTATYVARWGKRKEEERARNHEKNNR